MNNVGLSAFEDEMVILIFIWVGLAFLCAAAVSAVAVFVKASRELCLRKLEYRRYFSDKGVFEGGETELVEEFTNYSFVPMFVVDVETHISSEIKMKGCETDDNITQCFISRFFVMPYTKIRRVHKAVCQKRGYYKLESAKITFAGIEVYLDSRAELYVYPKEIEFKEQKILNHYMQYSALSKVPLIEDNFSFAGVRTYIPGDAMNAINYKQTARRNELMVNAREFMLGRRILIYLNFQPNETEHISVSEFAELLEKEISYGAYMIGECVRNGYMYSLSANSKMVNCDYLRNDFSIGESKYEELLCQMAEMGTVYGVSMASLIEKDIQEFISGTEIFLITSYLDEALESRIRQLEKMGNAVNYINVLEV